MMLNVKYSICLFRKQAEISLLFLFKNCFIKHYVTVSPGPNRSGGDRLYPIMHWTESYIYI